MNYLKSAAIAWVASAVMSAALAAPHDPNIQIGVTAYPEVEVTLSTRYDAHVAYKVVLLNNSTNTLNRAFFSATTLVTGAATNDAFIDPVILTVSGAVSACTQPAGPTSIRCELGVAGLLAQGAGATFWVVVRSPSDGTRLDFNSTFGGDEGNGGGNGCCDSPRTTTINLIDSLNSTSDPNARFKNEVKSFVKPGGGTFFTGRTGVATQDDPWTTQIQVPAVVNGIDGNVFTTAAVIESVVLQSCSAVNKVCHQTTLTIPGSFANLQVTLQQHPSIIKNGSKIENWGIVYSATPDVFGSFTRLQACAVTAGPTPGAPCIDICKEYTRRSDPTRPETWGIFECKIKALDNGRYGAE